LCDELHVLHYFPNITRIRILVFEKVRRVVRLHSIIKKDGLKFLRPYFLNYTWYVNDLHNI
jgi:hypothetical protein